MPHATASTVILAVVFGSCLEAAVPSVAWTNPNLGAAGGDWFDGGNWSGGAVPGVAETATIQNGGQAVALADTAPGPVDVGMLEVGTDFRGRIVVQDIDVRIAHDFHVARVINGVSSEGQVAIRGSQVGVGGTLYVGGVDTPHGGFSNANVNLSSTNLEVGGDLIAARADNTAGSFIVGLLTVGGGHSRIGFGNASAPGNVELATAVFEPGTQGTIEAAMIVPFSRFEVAGDLVIGRLAGGSGLTSNVGGQFHGLSSHITATNVRLGQRLDGTAGALAGTLFLEHSLLEAAEHLQFSADSTLRLSLPGLVRADGSGAADQYGSINAGSAALAGGLTLDPTGAYLDPTVAGSIDSFDLVSTAAGGTGFFDEIRYGDSLLEADFGDRSSGFRDHIEGGLFRIVEYRDGDLTFHNYKALPGDANGDGTVDGSDWLAWNHHKFATDTDWVRGDFNGDGLTDGADFLVWNDHKFTTLGEVPFQVPEHSAGILALVATLASVRLRSRTACTSRSFL